MSDKVYGYCEAGCKRRVPTYDEFERSASIVAIAPDEYGQYKLEYGKKYKVFASKKSDDGQYFGASLWIQDETLSFSGGTDTFPTRVSGDPYFTIMPISYSVITSNTFKYTYLYNDEGFEKTFEYGSSVPTNADFYITKADEVYLINDEAEVIVRGEDGKSAYEIAKDNGFEGTEAEWLASLKSEAGSGGKLYCHKYRVMLNGNGTFPEAYMNFAMYSPSPEALVESASDFLTQLKEKATIESIEVNLGEQEPALPLTGGVFPAMQRFSVTYYTDIATMTTDILSTTTYKIMSRSITEV